MWQRSGKAQVNLGPLALPCNSKLQYIDNSFSCETVLEHAELGVELSLVRMSPGIIQQLVSLDEPAVSIYQSARLRELLQSDWSELPTILVSLQSENCLVQFQHIGGIHSDAGTDTLKGNPNWVAVYNLDESSGKRKCSAYFDVHDDEADMVILSSHGIFGDADLTLESESAIDYLGDRRIWAVSMPLGAGCQSALGFYADAATSLMWLSLFVGRHLEPMGVALIDIDSGRPSFYVQLERRPDDLECLRVFNPRYVPTGSNYGYAIFRDLFDKSESFRNAIELMVRTLDRRAGIRANIGLVILPIVAESLIRNFVFLKLKSRVRTFDKNVIHFRKLYPMQDVNEELLFETVKELRDAAAHWLEHRLEDREISQMFFYLLRAVSRILQVGLNSGAALADYERGGESSISGILDRIH